VATALLTSGAVLFELQTSFFSADILQIQQYEQFDGTVYPIEFVPDWVRSSSTEREMSFSAFPVQKRLSLPTYNLERLAFTNDSLEWGNSDHDQIRNEKTTYPVVWKGDYRLDSTSNSGSHPAVDIKALAGTPVRAIANGVVIKASLSSGGFGYHVVIKHEGVPTLDDSDKFTTLYSGYAHLSVVNVQEGQKAKKGEKIGEVGRTGTATTNHLHFQIDVDEAPWHLYWPFTSAEAKQAGVTFFEAINQGLGSANVTAYTIDPMLYVQRYLSFTSAGVETGNQDSTPESSSNQTNQIHFQDALVTTQPPQEPLSNVDSFDIRLSQSKVTLNSQVELEIKAFDTAGNLVMNPDFPRAVPSLVAASQIGTFSKTLLESGDFNQGVARAAFVVSQQGETKIKLVFGFKEFVSETLSVVDQLRQSKSFRIAHDGKFIPDQSERIRIEALDEFNLPTSLVYFAGILEIGVPNNDGSSFSPKSSFTVYDFVDGAVSLSFWPKDAIEYRFYLNVNSERVYDSESIVSEELATAQAAFTDVPVSHSQYESIQYLYEKQIIGGYPDGTFKPKQPVSRVESLKFIYNISNEPLGDDKQLPFSDIAQNQWYSRYVATAYTSGVVSGYPDFTFKPEQQVILAEFLKMLFNALRTDVPTVSGVPECVDVKSSEWFSSYIEFALSQGLITQSSSGKCFPAQILTRGEVAEIIYRVSKR